MNSLSATFESDVTDQVLELLPATAETPSAYINGLSPLIPAARYNGWRKQGEVFLLDQAEVWEYITTTELNDLINKTPLHAVVLPFFKFEMPFKTKTGEPGRLILRNTIEVDELDTSRIYADEL